MRNYVIRRLLLIAPTLFIVSVLVFLSVRFIPGDVIDIMLSHTRGAFSDREALERHLGLDQPFVVQYGKWVYGIITRGDLGTSLYGGHSVTSRVVNRLPTSFELGLIALIISLIIALPIGIYSAIRQDGIGDYVGRSVAILFIAIPGFWTATMVMIFPPIWWGWSPPLELIPFVEDPWGNIKQFVIPAFVLGMLLSGVTMRMTRTMMLEVLRQDYIRTAWSKGLQERVVVVRHALKNAFIPVITLIALEVPVLIGGAVIIERIFALPGMGNLLLDSLSDRDYPVISGINLVLALGIVTINLATDLTYALLDPRVRYS